MTTRLLSTRDLPAGHPAWEFLTGRTPLFASQIDQRCSMGMYIPTGYRQATRPLPLLVAVHGTGRRFERTREAFVDFAEQHDVAVLLPLFPAGIGDPNDLHNYKLIDYGGIRFDEILLAMIEEARQRWNIDASRFLLAGFSGGGQFTLRFTYLHPDRVIAASVGAPGRVTLPDAEAWPYGVGDLAEQFGAALDVESLRSVAMQIVVGGDDHAAALLSAAAQDTREHRAGATRVARAETLATALRELGVPVVFDVVPGVAHDLTGVSGAVTRFLSDHVTQTRS